MHPGAAYQTVRRGPYADTIRQGWLPVVHHVNQQQGSVQRGVAFLRDWEFCGMRPLRTLSVNTIKHWYSDPKGLVLKPHYAAFLEPEADPTLFRTGDFHGRTGFAESNPAFIDTMKECFRNMRVKGLIVNSDIMSFEFKIHAEAAGLLEVHSISFSRSWCQRFARMHLKWSFRKATPAAQKLPPNWEIVKHEFVRRMCAVFMAEVRDLAFVVNADHTGLMLLPCASYTYEEVGATEVQVTGIEDRR